MPNKKTKLACGLILLATIGILLKLLHVKTSSKIISGTEMTTEQKSTVPISAPSKIPYESPKRDILSDHTSSPKVITAEEMIATAHVTINYLNQLANDTPLFTGTMPGHDDVS